MELAKIDIPDELKKDYLEENGTADGVYALEGDIKQWLKKELEA